MKAPERIVVVGASAAGASAAHALRAAGYGGALALVGEESVDSSAKLSQCSR